MYKFVYIRDEKIENKDCILVKEGVVNLQTKEYSDYYYNSEKETLVYWIEKSTGFVIGGGFLKYGENTATPQVLIKNIRFGEVTDDTFNDMHKLPNDYKVLKDNGEGGLVEVK